jgi:fatty-acyl-CoA synthase
MTAQARAAACQSATGSWVAPVASTYELLCAAAAQYPDAMLSIDSSHAGEVRVRSCAFPALVRRVTQAANLLYRLGVRRNDVVSLYLPTSIELLAGAWGAQLVGVAHPVDVSLPVRAALGSIVAAGSRVLVLASELATSQLLSQLRTKLPSLHVMLVERDDAPAACNQQGSATHANEPHVNYPHLSGQGEGLPVFQTELARQSWLPHEWQTAPPAHSTCLLLHTGWVRGGARLARLTHANLVFAAIAAASVMPLTERAVLLSGATLAHVSGAVAGSLMPFHLGCDLVLLARGQTHWGRGAAGWSEAIERHRVSALLASPALLSALVEAPVDQARWATLTHVLCGGAPLPAALIRRVQQQLGVQVHQGYGLTQASGVCTFTPAPDDAAAGSAGLALPHQELRCVRAGDEGGSWCDVPPGVTGRVQIRGPNVFAGYWDDRPAEAPLTADGWLDTGDVGTLDGQGHLHVLGRAKDLILRRGYKVEAAAIERTLALHPAVAAVAVVARPDPQEGEVPVANVVLHPGSAATPLQLLSHCSLALRDPLATPAHLRVVTALPRTTQGDIDRCALQGAEVAGAVRRELRAHGISANIEIQQDMPGASRLVIHGIPRGRRPTVKRVMEGFALPWRVAGEPADGSLPASRSSV